MFDHMHLNPALMKSKDEMSMIEKIQDELMQNISIRILTTPEEGKHINVGETFTVRVKLTNSHDKQVLIRSVEVGSGSVAESVDSGLMQLNTVLRPHEAIVTPAIRMKAIKEGRALNPNDSISVSYQIDFDPGILFNVTKKEKHPVWTHPRKGRKKLKDLINEE